MSRLLAVPTFALSLLAAALVPVPSVPLSAAEPAPAAKAAKPSVRVSVAPVLRRDMPVVLDLVGNAQSVASIPVKTRVDSRIETIGVAEGDRVAIGQTLFTLDDRAIRAQIAQARAVVSRDRAQLQLVLSDLERTRQLAKTATKSARDLESAGVQVEAQEATIAADQALLDNLLVQASWYVIESPIAGRIGSMPLKPGSSVRAADSTLLATINQIDPIHVAFAVPQASVGRLRAALATGEVSVEVRHPGEAAPIAAGRVAFLENTLDAATGTLRVKALIPNAKEVLLPGEYLQVRVRLATDAGALTVPESAVQMGQYGPFVWAVAADGTAEIRRIGIDRSVDGVTVVTRGLGEGDRVVIDGQLRLTTGTPLDIAAPASPSAPVPAAGASAPPQKSGS